MIRLDNNITNSDWTKARAFDFPTIKTLDDFMRMIGDIPLSSFADLPWVQVAPPEIRDAILASVEKARFASRSEAGRYAAEQRWKGHIKDDVQRSIVDRVREFSGLTVKILSGEAPATGFVVAMREHSRIVREQDFFDPAKGKAILAQYLKDKRDMLVGEQFLGLWHDKKNGEVVLDVVDNIQDRDDAIRIGQERNQQSIWDVVNEEEIDTGGTGDRETIGTQSGETTKAVERDDGRGNRDVRREGLRRIFEVYGSEVLKGRFASRSEAGRYAAEIRWQGHDKPDEDQAKKPVARDIYEVVKLSLDIYNEELSTEEQESIVNYTADEYADINGYFRRGSNDDDVVETAKMFDRTFNKASVVLGSDEIVYRGMRLMTDSKTLNWIQKLEIGDEFQDKGFVSTSYDKNVAEEFATPPPTRGNSKLTSVVFVIKTPKGTNVLAGNPSEDEIILPRGSTMIVSNIDKTVRGGTESYEIEMELLP